MDKEHGVNVKNRNRLLVLLDELKDEAKKEISFSEALYKQGDKVNAQFREGIGSGIEKAVHTIEKSIKE